MTDEPRAIRQRCEERGCRLLWTMADTGQSIDVDHATHTTSGSDVFVYRVFHGAAVLDAGRYDWNPEQATAIAAWVDQLHRMPLEEIP